MALINVCRREGKEDRQSPATGDAVYAPVHALHARTSTAHESSDFTRSLAVLGLQVSPESLCLFLFLGSSNNHSLTCQRSLCSLHGTTRRQLQYWFSRTHAQPIMATVSDGGLQHSARHVPLADELRLVASDASLTTSTLCTRIQGMSARER